MRKRKLRLLAGLLSMVLVFTDIVTTGFQVSANEIMQEDSDANTDDSSRESEDIVENELAEDDAEKTGSDELDTEHEEDFGKEESDKDKIEDRSKDGENVLDEGKSQDTTEEERTEQLNAVGIDAEVNEEIEASGKCGGNLTWTLVDGTLTISGLGKMYDYNAYEDYYAPWYTYSDKMANLVIKDGVTSIGDFAFYKCNSFTGDLIIPNNVTSIGIRAFDGCTGFTGDLIIPNNVTSIGIRAFGGCTGFTGDLIIPNSVTSLGDAAFWCCTGFTGNLTIGNNVTVIGSSVFHQCTGFTGDLIIPNSVTSIGYSAFGDCSGFTGKLVIGNNVTDIGNSAFFCCRGFTGDLIIPNSVTEIGDDAFINCSGFTGKLVIGNNVTDIGIAAFFGCRGFTGDLIIPNSVTRIDDGAFTGCIGFTGSLIIPDSVTMISGGVFSYCSGFAGSLIIPDNVASIGEGAFYGCDNITDIKIKNPDCYIADDWYDEESYESYPTIPAHVIIYGYANSTAQSYAEKYNRTFVVLDSVEPIGMQIVPMNFGDLVINGSGEATAYFCLQNKDGDPLLGRTLQYKLNGVEGITTVVSDKNGLIGVTTPHLVRSASFCAVFSSADGSEIKNNEQPFDVTVKELSYSQEWTGVYSTGVSLELGSSPDKVKDPVDFGVAIDLSKAITIKDEYDNGKRTLTLDVANKGGDSLKLKTGLTSELSEKEKAEEKKESSIIRASGQVALSEQANGGLKIENYDPTNIEHLKQIGLFAIVPVAYTSSMFWNRAFEKVAIDACNTEAREIGLGVSANANIFEMNIAGAKGSIWGYNTTSAWKWKDSYDYTGTPTYTTSKSLKISTGEGLGSGIGTKKVEDGDISTKVSIGGYACGYSISNSKEISAKCPVDSEDFTSISYKTYMGDEVNYDLNDFATDTYTTVTYSGDDAKNIFASNSDLAKWANGENRFIDIQDAINSMNEIGNIALVSETTKNKELAQVSIPIEFNFGIRLGITPSVSGEHSYSWSDATGALYKDTVYTTCVSDVDENQITSSANGLDDLFLEAANTVLAEMKENISSKNGHLSDSVQNDAVEVTGDQDVWFVVINTVPSNTAAKSAYQEDSYIVLSLPFETATDDAITAFSSVGNPYEIAVYTDDNQTTLVTDEELAENPVTLTFHYTTEMLESAGAGGDADVALLRYDRENDIYICVGSAVQDRQNMIVTANMTESGEYILAVDSSSQEKGICIVGLEESYEYTGTKIIPNIGVMDYDANGGKLLAPGVDYTVKYKNNTNVGTAEITVTGKGNYSGKDVSARFIIKDAENAEVPLESLKGARITNLETKLPYDGDAKYPIFTLSLKGETKQYEYKEGVYVTTDGDPIPAHVTLSNNINKGTATILLKGADNTKIKKTFKIVAIDLAANAAKVEVKATSGTYAVKGAAPASITVTYDGKKLKNGTDYTVKYSSNKKVTTAAKIVITGKGNYAKKYSSATFAIEKLDLSNVEVRAVTAYAGLKAGKVKATVVDGQGNALKPSQYTLYVYKDKDDTLPCDASEVLVAGSKIYVEAVANDTINLAGTTPRDEFDAGINIAKAKVTDSNGKTITKSYTGTPIIFTAENEDEPKVTLNGTNLKMGTDYEIVSYSNNINKGTATAVIKGIGLYSGTKTFKFKIGAKQMQIGGKSNWDDILDLIKGFISF